MTRPVYSLQSAVVCGHEATVLDEDLEASVEHMQRDIPTMVPSSILGACAAFVFVVWRLVRLREVRLSKQPPLLRRCTIERCISSARTDERTVYCRDLNARHNPSGTNRRHSQPPL